MKSLRVSCLATLALCFAAVASAQTINQPPPANNPTHPVIHQPPPANQVSSEAHASAHAHGLPPTEPIVHTWRMQNLDGEIHLTVHPDGSYVFTGSFKDGKPGFDWDGTVALKSSRGAVFLFHYEGDATKGLEFAKRGRSLILREEFASFATAHHFTFTYTFHSADAERRAHFAEMEKRREELFRAEEAAQARKQMELVAQKNREREELARTEIAWEEKYVRSHPHEVGSAHPGMGAPIKESHGGGNNIVTGAIHDVGSTLTHTFNAVGNAIGSPINAVGSLLKGIF